jgi:two-component system, NarL family, sensor kinase
MAVRRGDVRPEVGRAVSRFLALNLIAIVVVAAGAMGWSVHAARTEAVHAAEAAARGVAAGIVAPLCTPALRRGDSSAVAEMDRVLRNRMQDGSIVHVKVWTPEGRILYSDAAYLIGVSFDLDDDVRRLFGTDAAKAAISSADGSEDGPGTGSGNDPDNGPGTGQPARLVQTSVGIADTEGSPLLFEAYFPADRLDANARSIAWQLTPIALVTIVALQLLQLPLALALARRLDLAHRERGRLLEHAVAASDLERRRIARDLHDGVIQDLAGVAYLLDALELQLPAGGDRLRAAVGRAAGIVQADVRSLRRTMVDLYPPDLSGTGLEPAVNDLVVPLREAGVRCVVRIPDTTDIPDLTVRLLYRSARELLHNVAKHARAGEVRVEVERAPGRTVLTVTDDGVGYLPGRPPVESGHLGLRLLEEAVRDAGGELTVTASPGNGTTVRVTVEST